MWAKRRRGRKFSVSSSFLGLLCLYSLFANLYWSLPRILSGVSFQRIAKIEKTGLRALLCLFSRKAQESCHFRTELCSVGGLVPCFNIFHICPLLLLLLLDSGRWTVYLRWSCLTSYTWISINDHTWRYTCSAELTLYVQEIDSVQHVCMQLSRAITLERESHSAEIHIRLSCPRSNPMAITR